MHTPILQALLAIRVYIYVWECVFSVVVYRIQFLRHMRDFFQVVYKVAVQEEELETAGGGDSGDGEGEERETVSRQLVTLSCVGVGFSNYSKGIM